mmetsp:Transcript_13091/g.24259  ORF Transcript_13091/g.24259 Transcript_13091/m.24259 type:complete len:125 (+) Transcript_13091:84-458(+)
MVFPRCVSVMRRVAVPAARHGAVMGMMRPASSVLAPRASQFRALSDFLPDERDKLAATGRGACPSCGEPLFPFEASLDYEIGPLYQCRKKKCSPWVLHTTNVVVEMEEKASQQANGTATSEQSV